jgi:hypothetical protein
MSNDFYEEDEPLEKIEAIFERGRKVLTAPPSRGQTVFLDAAGNQLHGTWTT